MKLKFEISVELQNDNLSVDEMIKVKKDLINRLSNFSVTTSKGIEYAKVSLQISKIQSNKNF